MILDIIAWCFVAGGIFSFLYFLEQDRWTWSTLSIVFAALMIDCGILLIPL